MTARPAACPDEQEPVPEDAHATDARGSTGKPAPAAGSREAWGAWQLYFETTARLTARIEERLKAGGCSLMDYQLLLLLHDAPAHRMRLGELAQRLVFSPSRLSYQIGVLGRRGWVERRRAACDGRGGEAVLTAEGERVFRRLRPRHARDVSELFLSALRDDDAARLAGIMQRVAQRLEQ